MAARDDGLQTGRTTAFPCATTTMNLFWPLMLALIVLAAGVFYDDNRLPDSAVTTLNQGWFAFGVIVRMLLSVAVLAVTALLISAVLQTA